MRSISLAEFRREFLPLYEMPLRAPATLEKMTAVLDLVEQLGAEQTEDFTTGLVVRFVQCRSRQVCANTVRGELGYLRAAVNWAADEDWLDRVPRWRRLWPRASAPKRTRAHTIPEVSRVLQYLRHRAPFSWQHHRTYFLASLIARTGLRRDEALYARVEDFDLHGAILWVVDHQRLKTEGSRAPVPLCDELLLDAAAWLPRTRSIHAVPNRRGTQPWTSGGIGRRPTERLVAAGEACGVPGLTCQALRHAFATWGRRRWGISAIQMRDILRHETEETQEHYVHPEEELAELVRSVRRVRYR